MKQKILILFDIGAVLIKLSYNNFYKEAAKHSSLERDEIEREYLASLLDDRTNRGDINAEQFFNELRSCLQLSKDLTEQQIGVIIEHKFPGEIVEMITLKKELHQTGYAVEFIIRNILMRQSHNEKVIWTPVTPTKIFKKQTHLLK